MRVLVIKLSSLGDLFHALPAVSRVHEAWGAQIDWVTNQAYVELVRHFTPVSRVIAFPRKNFFTHAGELLSDLRRDEYDYVFDMQGLLKSALTARAARAGKRIGPSFYREGASIFYDEVTGPRNKNRHAVVENMDLLDHLGLAHATITFPVKFDQPVNLPNEPRIGLLPRSRWKTKNWPPEHFVKVAKELSSNSRIYLFGAPEDRDVCRFIAAQAGSNVTDMCAQTSLVELGGWLAAMDLVITVDSGPMHMAAATGTPVLAVFGATDHRRTGPFGDQHRVLHRDDLACRPCLSRTCQLKERDIRCLVGLSPEQVIAPARDMLASVRRMK